MSQMSNTVYKSFVAGESFAESDRWHFVTLDGANTVKKAGADDVPIGVLTDFVTGNKGTAVTVAIAGTVKVKSGGTVSQNGFVGADADGAAVAKASGYVRGLALADAVSGDIFEVLLVGPHETPDHEPPDSE